MRGGGGLRGRKQIHREKIIRSRKEKREEQAKVPHTHIP